MAAGRTTLWVAVLTKLLTVAGVAGAAGATVSSTTTTSPSLHSALTTSFERDRFSGASSPPSLRLDSTGALWEWIRKMEILKFGV